MKSIIKEKALSLSSSASGIMGFLGGWQVCHNVCLGIIALLSLIGITLVGMPLEFLTKVAVPIWIIAVLLLGVSIFFYVKKLCISRNLIIFNTGLIIAGTPFQAVQKFSIVFWIIGGIISLTGVYLFFENKFNKTARTFDYESYILYGVVVIAVVGLIISFTGFTFESANENVN